MVKSYRGKEVDIVSLAKKNEKTVALGNAHMNGRGDRLGRGGKIVETREEMLEKYYIYLSEEETGILERMLEDCKRRKREYALEED